VLLIDLVLPCCTTSNAIVRAGGKFHFLPFLTIMKPYTSLVAALLLAPLASLNAADSQSAFAPSNDASWLRGKGRLIFHDAFEREETGNDMKAIGNGWESATADRVPQIKQADLDDGINAQC
jgi:hypothetical protein